MDIKLTKDKMMTFDGHEKIGMFKSAEKLAEFGEKQNNANEVLALNIHDLIKRVCALEDKSEKHEEVIRRVAAEVAALKKEVDRLRLSDKLNSGAIERLDRAVSRAAEAVAEVTEESTEKQ